MTERPDNTERATVPDVDGLDRLRTSGELYRKLVECADEGIVVIEDDVFVDCNGKALEVFGRSREDLIGRTPFETLPESPEDASQTVDRGRDNLKRAYEGEPVRFDWEHVTAGGEQRFLDVTLTRFDLPDGPRILAIVRDITARRHADRELQDRTRFQTRLAEISNRFVGASYDDVETVTENVMRDIAVDYGVDRMSVWWFDREAQMAHGSLFYGFDASVPIKIAEPFSNLPWTIDYLYSGNREPILYPHELPAEAVADREYFTGRDIQSCLIVPLIIGDEIAGVAGIANTDVARRWPERERTELRLISHTLGNAWLRYQNEQRIREREQALQRSQRVADVGSYRVFMEDGSRLDAGKCVLRHSPQANLIYGIEQGEETLERVQSLIHPDDADLVPSTMLDVIRSGCKTMDIDYRIVRSDGELVYVEDRAEIERSDDGDILSVFGTVKDVTERVRAANDLQQALDEIQRQVEFQTLSADVLSAIVTARLADVNDRLRSALGQIVEAYGVDRAALWRLDRKTGMGRRSHEWARDGWDTQTIDTPLSMMPWISDYILNSNGRPLLLMDELPDEAIEDRERLLARDVKSAIIVPLAVDEDRAGMASFVSTTNMKRWTERERSELQMLGQTVGNAWLRHEHNLQIHTNELELMRSQRVARVGSYVVRTADGGPLAWETAIVRQSVQANEIFDIPHGDETQALILERYHPEDRQRIIDTFSNVPEDYPELTLDYRVLRRDGSVRFVEERAEFDRIKDGSICRVFGTVKDVTERVEAANELKKASAEIEALKDKLQAENILLREEVRTARGFESIIGESAKLKSALAAAEKVSPTDVSVLILGETGTGKELVARAIHSLSERRDAALVCVNCAALSADLIESELFGHEVGAFTGAHQQRKGRFELAHGGTLFLDEIGDLPIEVQAKLLRVLQSGEFERLGGGETLNVDVRVIAATNCELHTMVENGEFRADLFYRINNFPIELPPLRERVEDIPMLASHFVSKYADELGKDITAISEPMMHQLAQQQWPGNVRELEGVIQRAMIASSGSVLDCDAPKAPPDIRIVSPSRSDEAAIPPVSDLNAMQRKHIRDVLERCNWVIAGDKGAAAVLGIPPSSLRSRMKRLGISRPH